jgi:hypothetical protein
MIKKSPAVLILALLLQMEYYGVSQSHSTCKILGLYKNDATLPFYSDYINSIEGMKYKIPLVEEVNLRTETDQFDFGRQEYAVRAMFNGFTESKYYALEKASLVRLKDIEKNVRIKEVLYSKYKDIISLKYNVEKIPLIDSLETQYNHSLSQLIQVISSGEFIDPKDVLKIEENLYELSQKRKAAIVAISELKSRLNLDENSIVLFDDWISLNTIETMIATLMYKIPATFDQKYTASSMKNKSRFMMESANNKRILDYAQLRYSKRDNRLFQDEFSIGLGIRIPYQGSQIKSKNDYLLKEHEMQFEKNTESAKGEVDFKRDLIAIQSLIEEIKFYKNTNEKIFKTLNENHLESALAIINAKKLIELTNKQKQLDLEEKIVTYFINLVNDADKISELPLKNYLSENLSSI